MNPRPGLRERKKQRTREAIARAAHQLFVERGYHTTTLPDIAEAADVSTRTIFAYIPSKEDILFSDLEEMKDALARAVAERPEGRDALEVVREVILSSQRAEKNELGAQLHFCITSDPTLRRPRRAQATTQHTSTLSPRPTRSVDAELNGYSFAATSEGLLIGAVSGPGSSLPSTSPPGPPIERGSKPTAGPWELVAKSPHRSTSAGSGTEPRWGGFQLV